MKDAIVEAPAKPDGVVSLSDITLQTSVACMANLSIRGLDDKALAALKRRAAQEEASVNTLVVRLIEQGPGLRRAKLSLSMAQRPDGPCNFNRSVYQKQ